MSLMNNLPYSTYTSMKNKKKDLLDISFLPPYMFYHIPDIDDTTYNICTWYFFIHTYRLYNITALDHKCTFNTLYVMHQVPYICI